MKRLKDFVNPKKPWEVEGTEWREVRLGEIAEHFMGGTPKTTIEEYWNGNIPWISAKELSNCDIYITEPTRYITEKGLRESNARIAPKNSILLVTTASVGNVAIAGVDIAINQQITAIVPRDNICFKYMYYYLLHNAARLLLRGQTTFKHINQKMVKKLPIILPFRNNQPNLETQKKIVEYIEANFSIIDRILEKKKKELERLNELWESVLEHAFKPREEWREVRLGDLVIEKPKYGLTTKAKDEGKFVFLRITDIDDQGEIKNNNFKFVDLDETEKAKYDIRKGDLLLARSGSVGNFFIAFQDYPNWIYASYLIRFRLDLNKVHPMFVKHFLSSQYFKKWVSFQKRPGAQPNINAKEYSSFKISLPFRNNQPDLEKQKEIANYLDNIYEKIKILKEKIQSQINRLEEMKESILEEVFEHDKE